MFFFYGGLLLGILMLKCIVNYLR